MKSLLTTVIPAVSVADLKESIANITPPVAVVELRLDYLAEFTIDVIKEIVVELSIPFILTLRSVEQGGKFAGSEMERLELIKELMQLQPPYIDVESDVAADFLGELHQMSPDTKIICSSHNFIDTPQGLDGIYAAMQHPDVSIYKIITTANSSLDSLRMLAWVRDRSEQQNIVGHCMGADGVISRIAGPVVGNYFIYAAQNDGNAVVSHQVTVDELMNIYHVEQKDKATELFALIGDPVDRSVGHQFHNNYFFEHDINSLYIKIKIKEDELVEFMDYCHVLPFKGISVTMPLKKDVLAYVKNISGVDAVNTLKITDDKIIATNTDGCGAVSAITAKESIDGKNILVLGAGGSATAIVAELCRLGANVTIANRTLETGKKLAQQYNCHAIKILGEISNDFAVVVNTIPCKSYTDLDLQKWVAAILHSGPVIMDANYNQVENILLDIARDTSCEVITGDAMFVNQALLQLEFWD